MNFGEQIKELRRGEGLTQEQFGSKLGVTRQAISNWENNKNLPDIGMLILMSDTFHISLDQLIKGDSDMNNITEKIIKDGSETRRARFNMISTILGAFLLFLGFFCIGIKAVSPEYVDEAGILHESFFLLPMGFLFLFCGLVVFCSIGVRAIVRAIRKK